MDTATAPSDPTKTTITGRSFAEYCALNAVNWSTLKEMRKSPAHYAYRIANPSEDTTGRAIARAVHTAVLEPERFADDYAVFPGPRRAGKEWVAFEEANANRTILKADERDEALAIAKAIRSHPTAAAYLESGWPEETIEWTDPVTGLLCKGRMDWFTGSDIVDLKIIDSTSTKQVGMLVARNLWYCQLAYYQYGLDALGNKAGGIIIAAENKPPHDVGVFQLSDLDLAIGRETCMELLAKLKECREKKEWPGRNDGLQLLELPQWATNESVPTVSDIELKGEKIS